MDAYLSKPVRADELFLTIEGLLVEKAGRASGASASGAPNAAGGAGEKRKPAFDQAAFLARMDGSYEVCAEIAEAFFGEGPKLIERLKDELRRKDAAQIARAAHALKGAIANFTDRQAFQSAVRLEQAARESDLRFAEEGLPRLDREVAELVEELRVFVGVEQRV